MTFVTTDVIMNLLPLLSVSWMMNPISTLVVKVSVGIFGTAMLKNPPPMSVTKAAVLNEVKIVMTVPSVGAGASADVGAGAGGSGKFTNTGLAGMAHKLLIVHSSPLVEHSAAVAVPRNPVLQARATSQVGTVKLAPPVKSTPLPAISVVGLVQVIPVHELMIV